MAGLALIAGEIDERLVGERFDEAVAEEADGDACGANGLGFRHAFLNFGVGKGGAGADGTIVDEGAAGDDFGAAGDGDAGIDEAAIRSEVPDAEFGDLAAAAGGGVLVTFAAGLCVIKRSQSVG